jgi:mono/diheme cytochrome c family protein
MDNDIHNSTAVTEVAMRAGRLALWMLVAAAAGVTGATGAAEPSLEAGRALFVGSRPFQNGGAPCGACHAVGGEGMAFTASLGPELSAALAGLDPEPLDGLLETLPFPTMAPIYDGHALTPAERADLVAFLIPAARLGPPAEAWRFELLGALLAILLFALLAVAWRGRKGSTRARLLARAPLQGGSR